MGMAQYTTSSFGMANQNTLTTATSRRSLTTN